MSSSVKDLLGCWRQSKVEFLDASRHAYVRFALFKRHNKLFVSQFHGKRSQRQGECMKVVAWGGDQTHRHSRAGGKP